MSVADEVKDYLVGGGICTADQITVSRMPANGKVDLTEGQWVIVQQPGSRSGGNILQWKRTYALTVLYRNKRGEDIYNQDDDLQNLFDGCVDLPNYKVCKAICAPGGELPLEAKEVHVMQWAVTLDIVTKQ